MEKKKKKKKKKKQNLGSKAPTQHKESNKPHMHQEDS
jgi:hypothetical protein